MPKIDITCASVNDKMVIAPSMGSRPYSPSTTKYVPRESMKAVSAILVSFSSLCINGGHSIPNAHGMKDSVNPNAHPAHKHLFNPV